MRFRRRFNDSYRLVIEAGSRMPLTEQAAAALAALAGAVVHVVLMRADEKMRGVYASRDIAPMTNKHP
jgi:hypothetical protein